MAIKFSVLLYFKNDYQTIVCDDDDTCETVCKELCKENGFKPLSTSLFSLRVKSTGHFRPPGTKLEFGECYELRIRFKLPILSSLKPLDKNAFNYLYHQTKYDLVNSKIPELEYPNYKEKVVGLGVTNMYIDMLEKKTTIEECEKNYKNYLPEKHIKKHMFIIKKKVSDELRNIKNMTHDVNYVKNTYVETIISLAPTYLLEKYIARASYPREDELEEGYCPVELQFSPYDPDRPGFSVHYLHKKKWTHIGHPQDIYAILIDKDIAKLEFRDYPNGFKVQIGDQEKMESFVSCIAGYYRLMVKWTVDICSNLQTPTLQELRILGCHGPVGGDYSYNKLQEKQCILGSFILRQCEKVFDDYYLDIITIKQNIVTFRVTKSHTRWNLHLNNQQQPQKFDSIEDLIKSIQTETNAHYKLAPTEFDNSHLLLLCLPKYQLATTRSISGINESELRKKRPELLDPVKDLRKYINSEKITENGSIAVMRADWLLPDHQKLEVTMKTLRAEKKIEEFLLLAKNWSRLNSPELIKMFGFTVTTPYTYVIESIKHGPLTEFLRNYDRYSIHTICLIDAAYTLARALHYLQEQNIVHGHIRCQSLHVIRYELPNYLLVRLGDPGFKKTYTNFDLPWIPFEYHNNPNRARMDFKAEIFAYATTLWEIFTHAALPKREYFELTKRRPPQPKECPDEIYKAMLTGWNNDPSKRFTPQEIFTTLITSRVDQSNSSMSDACSENGTERWPLISDISDHSSDGQSIESIFVSSSELSEGYPTDTESLIFSAQTTGETMLSIGRNQQYYELAFEDYYGGNVIIHNEIGEGNYGKVFRGIYEYENTVRDVAIKQLKAGNNNEVAKDFKRESDIMRSLRHKNIVLIITWIESPNLSIVMEFVRHRNLLSYLKSNPTLTVQNLLKFAKEIASGMTYLTAQQIVHRDLAARNILVDDGDCMKISDFGLAQITNSNGYYVTVTERAIPIRWYAPESIREGRYSQFSDVWSYGVTLFEMFSRGQEPDLVTVTVPTPIQMLEALDRGDRLKRPEMCPQNIYDTLLLSCWLQRPKDRPEFLTILVQLERLINKYGDVSEN